MRPLQLAAWQLRGLTRNNGDNLGPGEQRKRIVAAGPRRFVNDRRSNRPRRRLQRRDAVLYVVAQEVRAKLHVNQVGRNAAHGDEQNDRHDGDENVGDDQAVAQAP